MRFTSIEIEGFRQYHQLTLNFPLEHHRDMHILVADNGVGKTNILNAITWCLYEEEPHLGNKSKSLPRYSLKSKEEVENKGLDKITVSVKIYAEDNGNSILFHRTQQYKHDPFFEFKSEFSVTATISEEAKIFADDEAIAYVDRYMPKKVRQYFFFDGEQLDKYFITDESSKIKEAIRAISQIDVLTRIYKRLGELITGKRNEAAKKAPDIKKYNDQLVDLQNTKEQISYSLNEVDQQITLSEAIIRENTEKLSGQENLPDLNKKNIELHKKRIQLLEIQDKCKQKLFRFIREMKVALSLYPSAKATLDMINEKEASHALPPNIDKKLLEDMLHSEDGLCTICHSPLKDESKSHIQELMELLAVSSETSHILMGIKSELVRIVDEAQAYQSARNELMAEYKATQVQLDDCEAELRTIDEEINKFQDNEKIIELHNESENHRKILDKNKEKRAIIKHNYDDICQKEEEAQNELTNALAKEKECERIKSTIDFLSRAQIIVSKIEKDMMDEVRAKMEVRTMEYFEKLIWKKGVYTKITLDSNYQLELIHRDGYSCTGSCSAAERSLLALSFTLALHEVSGFNALLFIDTPVSRVTGQNRVNFAKVLAEVCKQKQLIMAFTPDEYTDNISSIFEPIASSSVKLKMNTDEEITYIV